MTVLTRAAKDELGRDREVFESVAISVHPEKDEFKFQASRLLMEKGKKNIRQQKNPRYMVSYHESTSLKRNNIPAAS